MPLLAHSGAFLFISIRNFTYEIVVTKRDQLFETNFRSCFRVGVGAGISVVCCHQRGILGPMIHGDRKYLIELVGPDFSV